MDNMTESQTPITPNKTLASHLRDLNLEYEARRFDSWTRYFVLTYTTELEEMESKMKRIASRGGVSYKFPVLFQYYSPEWQQDWYRKFFHKYYGLELNHRLVPIDEKNGQLPPMVEVYLTWTESDE